MTKGFEGESCSEAIRSVMKPGEKIPFTELYNRIKKKGDWRDDSIWQDLMALIVNLPPARRHWKTSKPFLFIHPDGKYELYDRNVHPKVVD